MNDPKPSGLKNINAHVLKDVMENSATHFTHLFNESISTSKFPQKWSQAVVTPIPKTGNLKNVSNWRPISILSVPSKIMEKLIQNHLMLFLESNDLLSQHQYGFRVGKSTGEAIFDFVEDLFLARNNSHAVATCFVDIGLRKAFDCVSHSILLSALKNSKLNVHLLNWLESYLTGREQCTSTGGTTSEMRKVNFGVPQGSVLGPSLFIFFINSITEVPITSKIKLYADDLAIYSTHKDPTTALSSLQNDLDTIVGVTNKIGLTINEEKN